jgi:threonylcarbamoyladenosine tRNA methylthiotransferase MtaB
MKKYAIYTLGCKVNQYESQQIGQALEQLGLAAADRHDCPDILIVNTCCVTQNASAKSRQNIRKLLAAWPHAQVFATGCLPVGQEHELADLDRIIIAKDKNQLPAIITRFLTENAHRTPTILCSKPLNACKIKNKNEGDPQKRLLEDSILEELNDSQAAIVNKLHPDAIQSDSRSLPLLSRYSGQCRAFLKVQDGCDAYCTYCIIPKIRTNVCSKPAADVLTEARRLVEAGHKEIILTGIFLGAYGQETARRRRWNGQKTDCLADLVDQVAGVEGLERLRLSSLEPLDVTDRLLEVMTSHRNIAPHLHLALQAGSANVLRKMARQYSVDDFRRVIEKIRKAFDRPAITTDIIVGFPGEREQDFEETLQVSKESAFTKIHVFPFSVRKGTPAVRMAKLFGRVSAQEIRRRAEAMHTLDAQLQTEFRAACRGLEERVLVETLNPPEGLCGRYFTVNLSHLPQANQLVRGQVVSVEI